MIEHIGLESIKARCQMVPGMVDLHRHASQAEIAMPFIRNMGKIIITHFINI